MIRLNDTKGIRGFYTLSVFEKKPETMSVDEFIDLYHAGVITPKRQKKVENRIMLSQNYGLNLFIQRLGGLKTYDLELDNAGIGTGSTAPSILNTGLQTPVLTNIQRARVTINVDNLVTEWFITNDELPNGTYNEFALFCGTQIFCRSLIEPAHTKADNEDTLVEYTIQLTSNP